MSLTADFLNLNTMKKGLWLKSPAGIAQLQQWLDEVLAIEKIATLMQVNIRTLLRWCEKSPELAETTDSICRTTIVDSTRPVAYCLIGGIDCGHYRRGKILREHSTAEALWEDPFFERYFRSYGLSKDAYDKEYLKSLTSKGIYKLSNTYSIAHCEVSRKGSIKILKPPV